MPTGAPQSNKQMEKNVFHETWQEKMYALYTVYIPAAQCCFRRKFNKLLHSKLPARIAGFFISNKTTKQLYGQLALKFPLSFVIYGIGFAAFCISANC